MPAAAQVARSAAARRADQPPRRRVGRVARALPEGIQGHGRRRHARPLLPRQRGGVDPRARSRLRHSLEGQLLVVARSEAAAARAGREVREQAPEDARARARMDPDVAARPPVERQGATQRLRAAAQRGHARRRSNRSKSTFRRDLASATSSSKRAGCERRTAISSSWTI